MIKIPTRLRILIILQLCVGLSMLIWLIGYPFMGEHFKLQSEKLLIESVMGKQETLFRLDFDKAEAKMSLALKNKERFDQLEEPQKAFLNDLWKVKQDNISAPFSQKLMRAFSLLTQIPKTLLIWVLLAVSLPIFLLLNPARARPGVWLLPLITLGYCINNQVNGLDPLQSSEIGLFPKENTFIHANFPSQEEVKNAWDTYLVENWAKKDGSDLNRQELIHEGEFNFNLARIERLTPLSSTFWEKQSVLLLLFYLAWNLNFAWRIASLQKSPQENT